MSITAAEIRTQPDLWPRAAALAGEHADLLPAAGARVAVIGCGTSLFVAQAYAALRERAGLGETDAFAASEVPPGRRYDVAVAISRSGTTTEVVHALRTAGLADRSLALVAVAGTPVDAVADAAIVLDFADERSVVQTRFATSALTLLRESVEDGAAAVAAADAVRALAGPLPVEPADIDQWTFLGRGWTVGLAREAALKLREAAQAWTEAYPLFEYRHGPISIAAPGRAIWSLCALPADSPLRAIDGHIVRGLRPSALELDGPRANREWPAMRVTLGLVEHLGDEVHASFGLDAPRVTAEAVLAASDSEEEGDARLLADDERARFTAVLRGRTRVGAGDAVTLRLDHTRLHAFDPETGRSLAAPAGDEGPASYTTSTSTPSAASA